MYEERPLRNFGSDQRRLSNTLDPWSVDEPARPIDLGLGVDARRLGLQLRSLRVAGTRVATISSGGLNKLRKLRRKLMDRLVLERRVNDVCR